MVVAVLPKNVAYLLYFDSGAGGANTVSKGAFHARERAFTPHGLRMDRQGITWSEAEYCARDR